MTEYQDIGLDYYTDGSIVRGKPKNIFHISSHPLIFHKIYYVSAAAVEERY